MSTTTDTARGQVILHPALQVIRCNADEVMVRHGSRSRTSHTLSDGARRGLLADLAAAAAMPSSAETLTERLGTAGADDVSELLEYLLTEQVVVPAEQAESSLLHLGLGPVDGSQLAAAVVAVVGGGRLAAAVCENLEDLGAGVVRRDSPDGHDIPLEMMFGEADLVVVAPDTPDLALLYRANSAAIDIGTPWVMAYPDGPELVLGPLFVPGSTACFNDFDTQDEAGRTFRMDYVFYKAALAREGYTPRPLPRMTAELGASLTALGAAQWVAGDGSFLEGTAVRVDVERLEVIRELVLQLPRCPACSGLSPDYRHPFL